MRQLYILPALFLASFCLAQPTIQQAHLPQAGDTWTIREDTIGGPQYMPTAPGASAQTWNYSGLTAHETYVVPFIPTAGLPGADQFPNAQYATGDSEGAEYWYSFYASTAQGMTYLGENSAWSGGNSHSMSQNDVELPVPFTYGSNVVIPAVTTSYFINLGGPSSRQRSHRMTTFTGDAHGTMITPAFPGGVEVVRMRRELTLAVDSIFTGPAGSANGPWTFQSVFTYSNSDDPDYFFLRAATPAYVAVTVTDGSYVSFFESSSVGLAERAPRPSVSAYPNPTNGPLTIVPGNPDVQRLEVLDATGRNAGSYAIQNADRVVISTESWPAGAYHYRCLDGQGAPVVQGTFVVVD